MKSKKAQMMPMGKGINLILGLVVLGAGGLGLFGKRIGFELPALPSLIFAILITIAGFILMLDGFKGVGQGMNPLMPKSINLILGILTFLGGVALILQSVDVISLVKVPQIVLYIILTLSGLIMFFDGIVGAKQTSY